MEYKLDKLQKDLVGLPAFNSLHSITSCSTKSGWLCKNIQQRNAIPLEYDLAASHPEIDDPCTPRHATPKETHCWIQSEFFSKFEILVGSIASGQIHSECRSPSCESM